MQLDVKNVKNYHPNLSVDDGVLWADTDNTGFNDAYFIKVSCIINYNETGDTSDYTSTIKLLYTVKKNVLRSKFEETFDNLDAAINRLEELSA